MTDSLEWDFVVETWPIKTPYRFAGHVWTTLDVLVATASNGEQIGVEEAAGVYYHDDTPSAMMAEVESHRTMLNANPDRVDLLKRLAPGGLRNAIDCALWDLESKTLGEPVWQLAGISRPRPLVGVYTISVGTPDEMAEQAAALFEARALKLKTCGDGADGKRVRAVRDARRECWIGIDANQSLTRDSLVALLPALADCRVDLLEQPLPVGCDSELDGIDSPVLIAADESVQTSADLESLVGRVDVVNVKLDKCGGLTEALQMVRRAEQLGFRIMVGNMLGTSRAMAPGFVIGQFCDVVDLDGPLLIGADVTPGLIYSDGLVRCPEGVWGGS